jgi:hypothetical protein
LLLHIQASFPDEYILLHNKWTKNCESNKLIWSAKTQRGEGGGDGDDLKGVKDRSLTLTAFSIALHERLVHAQRHAASSAMKHPGHPCPSTLPSTYRRSSAI